MNLKELATQFGYEENLYPNGNVVEIVPFAYAIIEDKQGLHLLDVKGTLFNAKKIGRKSNITEKGFKFQLAQLAQWQKQIGEKIGA